MMPPYAYAAGRMAEERRNDAAYINPRAQRMATARPLRFGPVDRLAQRAIRLLAAGERAERPSEAVRGHARSRGLAGQPRTAGPQRL